MRHSEGSLHALLSLRSLDGKLLAFGDLTQTVKGGLVTSRLVYRFQDGSTDDETAVFTQNGHFHLVHDRRIQKGPTFPKPIDVTIDAKTNQVTVRYQEDGRPKVDVTHVDLPDDLANGIMPLMVKNIRPQVPETKVSYLAASPKPRVVQFSIKPDGKDGFQSAGLRDSAQRYRIHVELGGIVGLIAPMVGKEPADSFAWVSGGEVPMFMRSENPLYLGGPQLRTELATPSWDGASAAAK